MHIWGSLRRTSDLADILLFTSYYLEEGSYLRTPHAHK